MREGTTTLIPNFPSYFSTYLSSHPIFHHRVRIIFVWIILGFHIALMEKDTELRLGLGSGEDGERKDNVENSSSSKRRMDEDDDSEEERDDMGTQKKRKLVWTDELHQRFVDAITRLEDNNIDVVPTNILELMDAPGLTTKNISSHLQKYRRFLLEQQLKSQQPGNSSTGPTDVLLGLGQMLSLSSNSNAAANDHHLQAAIVPSLGLQLPPQQVLSTSHETPAIGRIVPKNNISRNIMPSFTTGISRNIGNTTTTTSNIHHGVPMNMDFGNMNTSSSTVVFNNPSGSTNSFYGQTSNNPVPCAIDFSSRIIQDNTRLLARNNSSSHVNNNNNNNNNNSSAGMSFDLGLRHLVCNIAVNSVLNRINRGGDIGSSSSGQDNRINIPSAAVRVPNIINPSTRSNNTETRVPATQNLISSLDKHFQQEKGMGPGRNEDGSDNLHD